MSRIVDECAGITPDVLIRLPHRRSERQLLLSDAFVDGVLAKGLAWLAAELSGSAP